MRKVEIAKKIERLFRKAVGEITDTRIYFSGKAWNYDSRGRKTVITDIVGSDYCYSNDDTITCSFEGPLYEAMYEWGEGCLMEQIQDMLRTYGYYAQTGNYWNFTLYQ